LQVLAGTVSQKSLCAGILQAIGCASCRSKAWVS
jgi:hypothetical protein